MVDFMPGGAPFIFPGGEIGALLIHGFTSAPKEMFGLGRYMADRGLTVLGVRLAGHGTHPRHLARMQWQDWYASVLDGYVLLGTLCKQRFAIGLSTGGALALYLAANQPIGGIVSMSTPLHLGPDARLPYVRVLKYARPYVAKRKFSDFHDVAAMSEHVSYPSYPSAGIQTLVDLLREVDAALSRIQAPVLLMHSRGDLTISAENMAEIYHKLGSPDKDMAWLERGGHIMTEDIEHETVYRKAFEFVDRRALRQM